MRAFGATALRRSSSVLQAPGEIPRNDSLCGFGAVLLLFLCFYWRLFHQAPLTIKYGG
jgi:hypothetical protein